MAATTSTGLRLGCTRLLTMLPACMFALTLILLTRAHAQEIPVRHQLSIPAQDLGSALRAFGEATQEQVLFSSEAVAGLRSSSVNGEFTTDEALEILLAGSGLKAERTSSGVLLIRAPKPPSQSTSTIDTDLTDAATGDAHLEEVVVTGTHIRGAHESASPMLRFERQDIDRSGFSTVEDFMASLPQNSGAGASQDNVGTDSSVGNNAYGTGINLRGLGVGTTLVLVNGRRLAPGGNSGRFVDVSMIPLSAVERVDVLTDGASAIYGSDAVGGVVNFILKKDYNGAETAVRYGGVTQGSLRETQASQSLGASWVDGGAMLAYEYEHRDALDARDRAFASGSDTPRTLLPEQSRHSVYASAHQDFGERWSMFGDGLYSKRHANNVLTYLSLLNQEKSDGDEAYGTLGAQVRLGETWRAELSTSYSRYRFDASFERTPIPDGTPSLERSSVNTNVWSADLLADGALMSLPGGAVRSALGASHRQENVRPVFSDPIPERHVDAAFGEIFVPLFGASNQLSGVQALELTLAARYENYSDFGNAITPKFGLRWQPVSGLNVRGTYGTSFKAPGLEQLAPGRESLIAFIASDFGLSIAGDPLILMRTQAAQPRLHEERSTSWTAGFDLRPPESSLSFSMTYFSINFTGRIDTPVAAGFEQFFNSPGVYGSFQVRNPGAAFVNARLANPAVSFMDLTGGVFTPGAVGIWADAAVTNIAAASERGVDALITYGTDIRWGRVDASLNGTYITTFNNKVAPLAPTISVLNRLNQPIDLRLRGGVSWSWGSATTSIFANYQDSYKNVDDAATPIASWTTFDAQLRYKITPSASRGLNGLTLALSVQNLFNRDPPFVTDQGNPIAHSGFDSVNATPLGRFVAAEIAKSW